MNWSLITVWTVVQTVLMPTFNPMGIGKFQPPPTQNRYSWTDQQNIQHSWLCPRDDPVYQIWYKSTHWGLLGKWVKYNKNYNLFIYLGLYLFSDTRLQVRPVDRVLRTIAQKTWNHAGLCLLGVIKLKFNVKPLFIHKTIKIWHKSGVGFFPQKTLNDYYYYYYY